MPERETAIEIHDLSVSYQHKPVLYSVDCEFSSSEITAIVGPNGAGKSTLLKAILGFLELSSGFVKIFGKPGKEMSSQVAYVPQREEVDWDFPITVEEVVMMARYPRIPFYRRPSKEDRSVVERSLETVDMANLKNRQISDLSGGQQQRVFLARALAQEPMIYLLDEPFSGIDTTTEKTMLAVFQDLALKGAAVVCVHHDLNTVSSYFNTALLLNVRKVAFGPAAQVLSEENILRAYSARPQVLNQVSEKLRQRQFVRRES